MIAMNACGKKMANKNKAKHSKLLKFEICIANFRYY